MGFRRLVKKLGFDGGNILTRHIIDAITKKKETGRSFRECLQQSVDGTVQESLPETNHLYQKGVLDDRIAGSVEQSQCDATKFQELYNRSEIDREK